MTADDREALLKRLGRFYGEQRFAIAWTATNRPDRGDPKKVTTRGWQHTRPLAGADHGEAVFGRGLNCNPAIVLRPSGLVGIECDGPEDLARVEALELPPTLTEQSSQPTKRHFYFRPPAELEIVEKASFRLESGKLTAAEANYYICAPALHPSGATYSHLPGLGPGEVEIATLPLETYRRLVADAETEQGEQRKALRSDPAAKVPFGGRHDAVFRFACAQRRWTASEDLILQLALAYNGAVCDPPMSEARVRSQVRGALKMADRPPDPDTVELRRQVDEFRREFENGELGEPPKSSRVVLPRQGLFLPFVDVRLAGPPRWLWRGKVPEGAVTLLCGRPKLGKSLLTLWVAAQLSRGELDGAYRDEPARTLIIAAEDPVDTIVKPRLVAARADQRFVGTLAIKTAKTAKSGTGGLGEELGGLDGLDGAGAYARRVTIPDEYGLLEQIIVENEVALLALDPINSFISAKVDAHRDAEIRRVLDPLAALAARHHFAALGVIHLNKRTDTDVLNRIIGSTGYGGSARSILTFGRHPENDLQRVVAAEGNWQKETSSDVFELREIVVFPDADPDDRTQPVLTHVGTVDLDSADLIDQLTDDRPALEEAKQFLLTELALAAVPVTDLRRGAEANGISWRTVERAKKLIGVEARRISPAGSPRGTGRWEWFLELVDDEQTKTERSTT